ncbi:hypothetical protein PG996_007772 [Apiospora saccharicola]|uniref:Uncharacterized protein n=1 Tax=Apiospora saccharicola TaxID=335842 RepID=A0ABR1UW13_9PEZI
MTSEKAQYWQNQALGGVNLGRATYEAGEVREPLGRIIDSIAAISGADLDTAKTHVHLKISIAPPAFGSCICPAPIDATRCALPTRWHHSRPCARKPRHCFRKWVAQLQTSPSIFLHSILFPNKVSNHQAYAGDLQDSSKPSLGSLPSPLWLLLRWLATLFYMKKSRVEKMDPSILKTEEQVAKVNTKVDQQVNDLQGIRQIVKSWKKA